MNKHYPPLIMSLTFIYILACSSSMVTLTPPPQSGAASVTLTPFSTVSMSPTSSPDSPEPTGFPFASVLNDSLPRENLLLARHFYSEPDVGHQADEICYDIAIYNDDSYIVMSCAPGFTYPAPTGTLDEVQSKFLHQWVNTFQAFDEPAIHGLLKFNGIGSKASDFSDRVSMQALLSEVDWTAHAYIDRGGWPLVVYHARSVLSYQLNLPLDNSNILNFEVVEFPDTCLGAPKPNENCEPTATQGFRIYLVANNLMYEYHTDVWGYDIRPFGEPQIAPTQGAPG